MIPLSPTLIFELALHGGCVVPDGCGLSFQVRWAIMSLCRPRRILGLGASLHDVEAIRQAAPGTGLTTVPGVLAALPPAAWMTRILEPGFFDMVLVNVAGCGCRQALGHAYWAVESSGFILACGYDEDPGTRRAVDDFLIAAPLPHIYCCTPGGGVIINVHKK